VSSTIDPEIGFGMERPFCCDCCMVRQFVGWIYEEKEGKEG
jgi:hypothetical protein